MKNLKAKDIAKAMEGEVVYGDENIEVSEPIIDSRDGQEMALFFALKGENLDGHAFIADTYDRGTRVMVVEECPDDAMLKFKEAVFIKVDDTLKALQKLAKWHMSELNLKTVAITGSVGKTTTRDLIYAGVSGAMKAGKNRKNLNSETGLPLTVLSLEESMEAAVLEMGMDAPGQIHDLVDIVRPDVAVITNIGISHIERLGSRENIFKAKMEVTDFFGADNKLIVNGDDDLLGGNSIAGEYAVIKAGTGNKNDYSVGNIKDYGYEGVSFRVSTPDDSFDMHLTYPGAHNAINCLLAIAACEAIGLKARDVKGSMESVKVTGNRLNYIKCENIEIIDDSYNAAPLSMISAIKTLSGSKGNRKVAILAGMNELGSNERAEHFNVGREIAQEGIDLLITIGEKGGYISEGALASKTDSCLNIMHFNDKEELYDQLNDIIKAGDLILIKASRGFALEDVTGKLLELDKSFKE